MFAERLRELRKDKGLTQIQFAEQLHVSNGAVAMWETGKREPDLDTIKQLADFFGVTVDYLVGNVNDPFFHIDNKRVLDDINSYGDEAELGLSDAQLMFALWGDNKEITEEDLEDVRRYAAFVAERKKDKK